MADARARDVSAVAVPLAVVAWAVASFGLYETAGRKIADVVVFVYAAALLAGPPIAYGWVRGRAASRAAALAAGLAVPALWLVKEMVRVTAVYSVPEALYYALNPLSLGLLAAVALQMALVEVGIRRRQTGAWRLGGAPAWTLGTIAALAVAAAIAGHDNGGRDIFYGYVALYRAIFAGS